MMRKQALPIAFAAILAFAGDAEAERRWFTDAAGVIVTMTDDTNAPAPDGTTAVLDATIRMATPPGPDGDILWGGVWDGTTYRYTPPAGVVMPIDPTTDIGGVQAACKTMLDVFETALDFIYENQLAWQQAAIKRAETGIHWQIVNAARVALNGTRTHARRQKYCEESASWPTGLSGDVTEYVSAMGGDAVDTPTKDWSWVDPEADPFTRHDVGDAAQGFNNATRIEDAPGSAKLIYRGWITDIP